MCPGGSLRPAVGPGGHKSAPGPGPCPAQAGTLWQGVRGAYELLTHSCLKFSFSKMSLPGNLQFPVLTCDPYHVLFRWEFLVVQSGLTFCRSSWVWCHAAPQQRSWRSWRTPLTDTSELISPLFAKKQASKTQSASTSSLLDQEKISNRFSWWEWVSPVCGVTNRNLSKTKTNF